MAATRRVRRHSRCCGSAVSDVHGRGSSSISRPSPPTAQRTGCDYIPRTGEVRRGTFGEGCHDDFGIMARSLRPQKVCVTSNPIRGEPVSDASEQGESRVGKGNASLSVRRCLSRRGLPHRLALGGGGAGGDPHLIDDAERSRPGTTPRPSTGGTRRAQHRKWPSPARRRSCIRPRQRARRHLHRAQRPSMPAGVDRGGVARWRWSSWWSWRCARWSPRLLGGHVIGVGVGRP